MTALRRWSAAFLPPSGDEEAAAPLSERGWRTTVTGLHVISAMVWGLAVVAALLGQNGVEGTDRSVALLVLGVLAVAYVLAGAPAFRDGRAVLGVTYLVTLVAAFGVLGWVAPSLFFLLFLAYPHVWFVVQGRPAGAFWTVLLAAATTVGPLFRPDSGDNAREVLLETAISLVFSLALGLWISRVLAQSEQRAELIEQLESTRAELAAAHHDRGVLAERERLAREVHDTLAQGYTSIVVLAQTVAAGLPPGAEDVAERVALIEEVARENLAEARAMVAAFAPVALDSATLVEALERLVERFGRETGLATRLDTAALGDGGTELSRSEEVVLLRGAQEALANVRRHAAATAVVLRVSRVGTGKAGQVSVHVEDDGVGFDPASAPGVGLAGLRDRAEQVGGAVDVVSSPGEGTRVTVRVPVR
ncbi:sensor histidine kinase [Blastococcus haudaquaticus]|uniref:Oxygen sensor histidine kinase NreB n=1 Tax=Blastococcus haudaquaticus TaxID=1938745 RepID=A0A286H0G8_9ACTN|nr:sensor histidine kinase [Blastococcus haudaquaticus]SOE01257.1 Signal transduction histidine kinase [Blastococcus haudaquaticus]